MQKRQHKAIQRERKLIADEVSKHVKYGHTLNASHVHNKQLQKRYRALVALTRQVEAEVLYGKETTPSTTS